MREKKFERFDPDERKDLLVKSAVRCLKADGYAGLSVRKITKEANVSLGLINHHFGSMDALVISAYEVISLEFLRNTREKIAAHQGSAADKLDLFFRSYLSEENVDPDLLKAWLVFWSLIRHSQEMAQTYEYFSNEIEALLSSLLRQINKEENIEKESPLLAVQSLMALLDGVWVKTCLSRKCLPPEHALRIVRNWVNAYTSGFFRD